MATCMTGPIIDAAGLAHAVLAQLKAAHKILATYSKMKRMEQANAAELNGSLDDNMTYLVERHTIESVKSRADWLKFLGNAEKLKLMESTRVEGS